MASFGSVDYSQLKEMQKTFEAAVGEIKSGKVYERALKECGAVHLANCISETPYGDYPTEVSFVAWKGTPKEKVVTFSVRPKHGGTLKKGWVKKSHAEAEASKGNPTKAEIRAMVKSTPIYRAGKSRRMTFFNRVKYAHYVDKGHRIMRKGRQIGWVAPQNFIRNAENQTAGKMPAIIEKHIMKALQRHRGGR